MDGRASTSDSAEQSHAGKKRKFEDNPVEEAAASAGSGETLSAAEYKSRVRTMLSNLTKEACVEILADLGAQYQPVYDHVVSIANRDEANRKLFLHGLNWETTADSLRKGLEAEKRYGEILNTHVVMDKVTGKSKAFGFVTFASMESAIALLEAAKKDELVIDVS
jgi:heterogeneous nuclear ribonucleoprotein A1/A3